MIILLNSAFLSEPFHSKKFGLDHHIGHFRPLRVLVRVLASPHESPIHLIYGRCSFKTQAHRVADAMIEAKNFANNIEKPIRRHAKRFRQCALRLACKG
jgi:hypothetical protein